MRKTCTSIIAVILLFTILIFCVGCSNSNREINSVIKRFQNSCNTLDFDGVLDCINPKISNKIKSTVGIVGMISNTDTDEIFNNLAEYLSIDNVEGAKFFSSIKIKISEINVKNDTAEVSVILTYDLNGDEAVREGNFNCDYYAEKWYISTFILN